MRSGDHSSQEEERGGHLRRGLPPLQGLHRLCWCRRPRQGLRVDEEEKAGGGGEERRARDTDRQRETGWSH